MKIRIQGNSIRLRLSQTEVSAFSERGLVEDSIQFGPSPEETLFYTLERTGAKEIGATFASNQIRVFIPESQGTAWAGTGLIGLEHEMDLGNGNCLRILVEKDFQCLTARPGEDESDNFPNPNVSC